MRSLSAIMVVALIAVPRASSAQEDFRELSLKAGVNSLNVKDGAFDIYSDSDWLTGSEITIEVELLKEILLQVGCTFFRTEATVFGRYTTTLSLIEPHVGLRWGYMLKNFFRPYVSALASYGFVESQVELPDHRAAGFSDGFVDGRWGGRFALGLELFIPRKVFRGGKRKSGMFKDFTLGAALEGGYKLIQKVDLNMVRGGADEDDDSPFTSGSLELGELNLSGFYLAVDLRFYF